MKSKEFLKNAGTLLLVLVTIAISTESQAVPMPTIISFVPAIMIANYDLKITDGGTSEKMSVSVNSNRTSSEPDFVVAVSGQTLNFSLTNAIAAIVGLILLLICLILSLVSISILRSLWTHGNYKVPPL